MKAWLARLLPFWLAVVAVVILRATILGKSGHYSGQYLVNMDISKIWATLWKHLETLPRAIEYAHEQGFQLFGQSASLALVVIVALVMAWQARRWFETDWRLRSGAVAASTVLLAVIGLAIVFLGGLPYALAGLHADVTRLESRFAFPSQFGALILIALAIQCLPTVQIRAAAAAAV